MGRRNLCFASDSFQRFLDFLNWNRKIYQRWHFWRTLYGHKIMIYGNTVSKQMIEPTDRLIFHRFMFSYVPLEQMCKRLILKFEASSIWISNTWFKNPIGDDPSQMISIDATKVRSIFHHVNWISLSVNQLTRKLLQNLQPYRQYHRA